MPSGIGSGVKEGYVSVEVREAPSVVLDEGDQEVNISMDGECGLPVAGI